MADPAEPIRTALQTLLPDGVSLLVEEGDGEWITSITSGDERHVVGRGTTALESVEAAQQSVLVVVGVASLISAIGDFLKRSRQRIVFPRLSPTLIAEGQPTTQPPDSSEARRLADRVGDFGWRLVFAPEPDGSYRWWVFDSDGEEMFVSGAAEEWDDAKLNAILDLLPPSDEAPR